MAEVARQPHIGPEMLISNLSLPVPVQMAGGLKTVENYTGSIGADGLELTPSKRGWFMGLINGRLCGLNFAEGEAHYSGLSFTEGDMFAAIGEWSRKRDWWQTDQQLNSLLRSYHASPRDADAPKFDPLGRLMFPHYADSFAVIFGLQRITGARPGVVFPYYDGKAVDHSNHNLGVSATRFQPKPRDWLQMGLHENSPPYDVREKMTDLKLDEIAWPAIHAQNEQEGISFADPLDLCNRLASVGLIGSFHLELDRQDVVPKDSALAESTRQAKEAFIKSEAAARKTLEGEMLIETAHAWKMHYPDNPRSVVVETLPQFFRRQGAREHTAIIEHAQAIIEAA